MYSVSYVLVKPQSLLQYDNVLHRMDGASFDLSGMMSFPFLSSFFDFGQEFNSKNNCLITPGYREVCLLIPPMVSFQRNIRDFFFNF